MRKPSVFTLVALLVLAAPGMLGATPAALPSDRLLFDSDRTGNYEIWAMQADGSAAVQLTEDDDLDSWWPRLSPDRQRVLFHRSPAGVHDRDFTQVSLWVMNVDGTAARLLVPATRWDLLGHAEWSPDGQRIAVFAGSQSNPQIWVLDADGTNARQVTQRGGTNIDPSWRPDGRALLFIGCPIFACLGHQYEVYEIGVDGTGERRLTVDLVRDHDPYYSPDGSSIAWLRNNRPPVGWSIFRMAADGTAQRPVIEDLLVNSKPSWSPDGEWIWFHRTPVGRTRFNVFRIRPDGTGLREVNPPASAFGDHDNEFPSP